ncbi:hypothetical protein KR032_011285 [Drosophila birchii]|nr:hypothetical protein KR032_011285 [Drosophila birchii]
MKLHGLIAFALISIWSLGWCIDRDYCDTTYCGMNHLVCRNPDQINVKCPTGVKILPTIGYRSALLTAINEFRNHTACGGGMYLKPAARMARMSYSPELEEFARLAVITCSTDKFCLSTKDFYYVGYIHEAIYYIGDEDELEDLELILRIIQDWTKSLDNINVTMAIRLPDTLKDTNTINTALLMAEQNTHIGCSALRFTDIGYHYFVFACAFSTDLIVHRPIYRMSGRAGSACKYRDPIFPSLCSPDEDYESGKAVPNATILLPPISLLGIRSLYMKVL